MVAAETEVLVVEEVMVVLEVMVSIPLTMEDYIIARLVKHTHSLISILVVVRVI